MISLSIRVVVASFQHIPLGTLPQLTKTKKAGDFSLASDLLPSVILGDG